MSWHSVIRISIIELFFDWALKRRAEVARALIALQEKIVSSYYRFDSEVADAPSPENPNRR
jgi:hypothetical protein